jgi:asparagine synthase (glutamine-hydrolysing)
VCGFFGAIRFEGYFGREDYDKFLRLTDLVSYRGPDASGYRAFTLRGADTSVSDGAQFSVFLGHRRLSIIDLSPVGTQPFTDDEGLWVVFQGEIFNYVELREELIGRGHRFKSHTDTEVILKVYREYGEAGFDRLNGMWAFAILDVRRHRVVLSRDRFAVKPLYFHHDGDAFYFASEIKQLVPIVKGLRVNRATLFTYLRQGIVDHGDETFFAGIHQARARHTMLLDLGSGSVCQTRYWDYDRTPLVESDAHNEARFRDLLVDAVKIRLRSDVPVGCMLSGGLDSSSIAVVANTILGQGITCYSVVAEDRRYSEERFVDVLAGERGVPVEKLRLRSEESWDHFEKVAWHQDEPRTGFSAVAENLILKAVKKRSGIKVVLSGEGGDELLCGYRKYFFFYLRQLAREGRLATLCRNALASLFYGTVLWQFSLADAKRYVPSLIAREDRLWLNRTLIDDGNLEPVWRSLSILERQYLDIDRYSVPNLNHTDERNAAAYGLELRFPFYDYRLVDFCTRLPDSSKIRNGWSKYILRTAVHELPRRIAWRRDKQGFVTPEDRWMRHEFRGRIVDLFEGSQLHDIALIDKHELLRTYGAYVNGSPFISSSDVFRFVMAEVWYRTFFASSDS